MKNIIWLSPSLAAGAIAARVVVFFKNRPQNERPSGEELRALDVRWRSLAGRQVSYAAVRSGEEAVWLMVILLIASDDVRFDVFRHSAICN